MAKTSSSPTVVVRAIDTTARLVCDAEAFVQPLIAGHDKLNMRTMCFLLEHQGPDGLERVLFDCGARKDYWNGSPHSCRMIGGHVPSLEVEMGVDEILVRGGVQLSDLKAMVWSHWHWDHIGDGSKFPPTVDIVVGPGFTEAFAPGYPARPDSFVRQSDLEGHRLHEPTFDIMVAGYRAHDYFGDGSFYLLDVPGHALGHICGLVKTTATTYIFLGADCCHFPGVFRPSPSLPLPEHLPADVLDNGELYSQQEDGFPTSIFLEMHPLAGDGSDRISRARTTPFYQISRNPGTAYTDGETAQASINKLMPLDADPNTLICVTHDNKLFELFPLFNDDPTSSINDWQQQRFDERARWDFLNDLPFEGKRGPGRKPLVDGLRRGGKRLTWTEETGFQLAGHDTAGKNASN